MIQITDGMYATMVEAMTANGRWTGTNAAAWWYQETLGGRASGDTRERARIILAGLHDCDPMVLDTLPSADLSGEWADGDTAESVYGDASGVDWPEWETLPSEVQTDLADAWCDAFNGAAMDAAEQYCADLITSSTDESNS